VLLRVNLTNPLGEAMPYEPPAEMRSIAEPTRLGLAEDRTPVAVRLPGSHVILVGRTGSGKTTLELALLYDLVACEDAVVWVADPHKAGARFRPLEPCLGWLATSVDEAKAMFAALLEIRQARARWRAEAGHGDGWPLSREYPLIVVIVDASTTSATLTPRCCWRTARRRSTSQSGSATPSR
jgi:hypothetical protein